VKIIGLSLRCNWA